MDLISRRSSACRWEFSCFQKSLLLAEIPHWCCSKRRLVTPGRYLQKSSTLNFVVCDTPVQSNVNNTLFILLCYLMGSWLGSRYLLFILCIFQSLFLLQKTTLKTHCAYKIRETFPLFLFLSILPNYYSCHILVACFYPVGCGFSEYCLWRCCLKLSAEWSLRSFPFRCLFLSKSAVCFKISSRHRLHIALSLFPCWYKGAD